MAELDINIRKLSERNFENNELSQMFDGVQKCVNLRSKYLSISLNQEVKSTPKDTFFKLSEQGVFECFDSTTSELIDFSIPSLSQYYSDLDSISTFINHGPTKSFFFRRLKYLELKFQMYLMLNEYQEKNDVKSVPHRDFYNVRKVDTHIHHSACMNQKHLLRFIKHKLKACSNEVCIERDSQFLTLQQVFDSLNLSAYDLSIDTLDMHAHKEFHRFDNFNLKYNPMGESRLREIFLKTDNFLNGRYLAELTQQVISDLEATKYQMVEWRLSIYGRSKVEWSKLAKWVLGNNLRSNNVRWLIQVPRLYDLYKKSGVVNTFQDMLDNIFEPLFMVTRDPSYCPELAEFLKKVVGFDSVDDESKFEKRTFKKVGEEE